MKNHPVIDKLEKQTKPVSTYGHDLLWLFKNDLNTAFENKDILTQAKVLAEMLFHCAQKSEHEPDILEILEEQYRETVQQINNIISTPLRNATIVAHQYFQEKLDAYKKNKAFFTEKKISFSLQLMKILAMRNQGGEGYQLAILTTDTSGPPAFIPTRTFETHIDFIMELHQHECNLRGVETGKFGLLLQLIRNNRLTQAEMPKVQNLITEHNSDAIRDYFNAERQKTEKYSYFQRRWLNQLSQTHKKPVEYYQAWTDSNPYQHARSLALSKSAKWAVGMIVLAVAVNLVLAAATGGVGNLVAITAAYAAISSTPGGYAVLAGATGAVSGMISYGYHKAQYAFKQQAITDCIACEPAKQTPDKTMG